MEDRKRRFDEKTEVRGKIADALNQGVRGATFFDGVHVFTPHADVPDDGALRLVVLPPESWYSREEVRPATDAVLEWMQNNGTKPRHRQNRLLFLAADHGTIARLNDAARIALAWGSIVSDVEEGRLNIDRLQETQAKKELQTAKDVLPRAARECYKWLLCPVQETPQAKPSVEAFPLNTTGSSVGRELERVATENELVITGWSPIHLRTKLKELYWKGDHTAALSSFGEWNVFTQGVITNEPIRACMASMLYVMDADHTSFLACYFSRSCSPAGMKKSMTRQGTGSGTRYRS
jgi:predicted AAA+ superfamily ATPase